MKKKLELAWNTYFSCKKVQAGIGSTHLANRSQERLRVDQPRDPRDLWNLGKRNETTRGLQVAACQTIVRCAARCWSEQSHSGTVSFRKHRSLQDVPFPEEFCSIAPALTRLLFVCPKSRKNVFTQISVRKNMHALVYRSCSPTSIGLFCHSSSCVNRSVKSANQLARGRKLGQARFAQVAGT